VRLKMVIVKMLECVVITLSLSPSPTSLCFQNLLSSSSSFLSLLFSHLLFLQANGVR
jgi:hypothetical protein